MAIALIVDRFLVGRKRAVTELIENWHSEKYLRQTFPDISSQIRPIADTVVSFVTHENKERLIT